MKWEIPDAYCYPGTSVLRNYLEITDANELAAAERTIVGLRNIQLFDDLPPPPHNLNCLLGIHQTLFGKLYPFAGKLRLHTGRMTKTRESGFTVVYCDSAFIPEQIGLLFNTLAAEAYLSGFNSQDFAQRAAYFYGELDAIHPFREGNSRTLRLFFSGIAKTAGLQLDWRILADEDLRQQLYAARDRAVMRGDLAPLTALFVRILSSR